MDRWDYIVVGAGSAGCALANRLSANPDVNVLLLEAGGADLSPYIHMPAAIIRAIGNPSLDWCYQAEPDPSRNDRVDLWPAGKTFGGSSSINGMLYVRGAAADFDRWQAEGCPGWSYADVLPFFKRMEATPRGEDQYRGRSGPVRTSALRTTHPLAHTFVHAARDAGIPLNEDYNGASQEGVAYSEVTQQRGWRYSAARAYLHPARRRPNLSVQNRSVCERLMIEHGRCVGVEYVRRGARQRALCQREVILSAGAIASPKLLMLSGIGPAEHLRQHGIDVVRDLPGVGANLQEHPEGMVGIDVNVSTYNTEINSWKIVLHGANWLLFGRGPATSPYPHAVAFIRSTPEEAQPDIQVQLGPYAFSFSDEGVIPYDRPAISAAVNISYPRARGSIRLRSPDPDQAPVISHGLLADEDDMARLIKGCQRVREILNGPAFADHRIAERLPGPDVQNDADWRDYLRQTAFLGYHPSGTCKMGSDDLAVTRPDLKVCGLEGLRVADASIMPSLTSGNTNATVMMIGERAAEFVQREHSH
jgi:choline dehydrogenase